MKRTALLLFAACLIAVARAESPRRFAVSTSIGTALALDTPASTPFTWHVTGWYAPTPRFSAGVGTGLSCYEKTLVPLYACARFALARPRRFTPYAECRAGYGLAAEKNANGGLFLNPSVGIQYAVCGKWNLFFAVGYELQKSERLKRQMRPLFTAEFAEKLRHNGISFKVGILF